MPGHPLFNAVERDGYAIIASILSDDEVDQLIQAIDSTSQASSLRRRRGAVFGGRDLMSACPAVRSLAGSETLEALVTPVLGVSARPVRAIFFDKTPAANWTVAWHQDRTIAVRRKVPVDGYGPWSVKAGIPHVEPPIAILENMITIRIHLDDCGPDNGPLLVVPGSHRRGRIDGAQAADLAGSEAVEMCPVPRGGAMLMRPLLLHASRKAARANHRRVLSLDFCAMELGGGLQWHADGEVGIRGL